MVEQENKAGASLLPIYKQNEMSFMDPWLVKLGQH